MLQKTILNTEKKRKIVGDIFHLIFLGTEAVLYDSLLDSPIIYANKALVRNAVINPKKLTSLLPPNIKEITLFLYKINSDGKIEHFGNPLKGKPIELIIPNH